MGAKDIIAAATIEYYSHYPESMREDILHTQEVVSYTRLIAIGERLTDSQVDMLECAAWLHDIGCPRSKQIYGDSLPQHQQSVGREVSALILDQLGVVDDKSREWLTDVVGTHHQLSQSETLKFAPLFEADMIVNILSGYHPISKAKNLLATSIKSESGKRLFHLLIKVPQ